MQPKNGDHTHTRVDAQESVPPPIVRIESSTPSISPSVSLGLEGPLPIDSDAELAYANGTIRPHRLQHHKTSPTIPSVHHTRSTTTGQDGRHRSAAVRRRWSLTNARRSEDTDPIAESDYGRATPDPPPLTETEPDRPGPPPSPTTPAGLLRRLRTASTTFSPFSSLRRVDRTAGKETPSQTESLLELPWSGDSSSDDDDLSIDSRRHVRNPSILESWDHEDDDERGRLQVGRREVQSS